MQGPWEPDPPPETCDARQTTGSQAVQFNGRTSEQVRANFVQCTF